MWLGMNHVIMANHMISLITRSTTVNKVIKTFIITELSREYVQFLNRLYDITWFGAVYEKSNLFQTML